VSSLLEVLRAEISKKEAKFALELAPTGYPQPRKAEIKPTGGPLDKMEARCTTDSLTALAHPFWKQKPHDPQQYGQKRRQAPEGDP
jgi:hypothetical protein